MGGSRRGNQAIALGVSPVPTGVGGTTGVTPGVVTPNSTKSLDEQVIDAKGLLNDAARIAVVNSMVAVDSPLLYPSSFSGSLGSFIRSTMCENMVGSLSGFFTKGVARQVMPDRLAGDGWPLPISTRMVNVNRQVGDNNWLEVHHFRVRSGYEGIAITYNGRSNRLTLYNEHLRVFAWDSHKSTGYSQVGIYLLLIQ